MRELIINPEKIKFNKKKKYIFIAKWFLRFLPKNKLKNINYIIDKNEKKIFDFKSDVQIYKKTKLIHNNLIKELYPILNKLNNVNWNLKTWNFFIGHWIFNYIAITLQRIHTVKNLNLKNVNIKKFLNLGKNTCLTTYTNREYTFNSALPKWNEKIFSRILYLKKTKNFNNKPNLVCAKKKIKTLNNNFFKHIFFHLRIIVLKFFERILCYNNKYLFYNAYFKDKLLLLKIFLALRNFPFVYSFNFFDKEIVKQGVDYSLRSKINLNLKSKNFEIKLLKFLVPESLPTIYLEGFNYQKKISNNSFLPKKIKKIFTSSAYAENSFKFWLADQINKGAKLYFGQHGAGYNIKNYFYPDYHEPKISYKNFAWGNRIVPSSKIPIGNQLINLRKKKLIFNNKYLLILETLETFKRGPGLHSDLYLDDQINEIQQVLNNVSITCNHQLNIRTHPQSNRRALDYKNFLKLGINSKIIYGDIQQAINRHSVLIFPYLSTEFLNQIAMNKPCMLLLNKQIFNKTFNTLSKKDFTPLIKNKIVFFNGKTLAEKLNSFSKDHNNIYNWWNNKKLNKIKSNFCKKYSDPKFKFNLFLKILQND